MKCIVVDSHIYARCPLCHKFVRMTGWHQGWHLCI
jgi:hypothetical protein